MQRGTNVYCLINPRSQIVSVQTESDILEIFRSTLQRLNALQPEESRWLYGIGDTYFDEVDMNPTFKDPLIIRECIK